MRRVTHEFLAISFLYSYNGCTGCASSRVHKKEVLRLEVEITKDAEKMLVTLYKVFLNRRKDGQAKRDARRFSDDFFLTEKPFTSMNSADVADSIMELGQNGLLRIYIGGDCDLSDAAIFYLENRFKNGLADTLSFLAQFIP